MIILNAIKRGTRFNVISAVGSLVVLAIISIAAFMGKASNNLVYVCNNCSYTTPYGEKGSYCMGCGREFDAYLTEYPKCSNCGKEGLFGSRCKDCGGDVVIGENSSVIKDDTYLGLTNNIYVGCFYLYVVTLFLVSCACAKDNDPSPE